MSGCGQAEGGPSPSAASPSSELAARSTSSEAARAVKPAPRKDGTRGALHKAEGSPSAATKGRACASANCSSIERCDETTDQCVPNCPHGEVYVPATPAKGFVMGRFLRGNAIDTPHKVVLTKPFCMDATEVTVKAYASCVDAGDCTKPRTWGMWRNYPTLEDHPVNKVDWKQATAYCASRKQSLPSEAQWEWAATGGDGRKWAWGSEAIDCERADYTPGILRTPSSDDGCQGGGTSPVGTHPKGDRVWPDGKIHDLTGNVWEWCIDNYGKWHGGPDTDPVYMKYEEGVHVVRGGGWNRSSRGVLAHYRGGAVVGYRVPGLGFRCVRNPDDAKRPN